MLQANQNLTLNITLELGELSETVTVAGQASTVDITQSALSEVVDSKRIVELPLNGRDAARLSMLVSGMVVTEVNQESGKTIPGALRLSTNGTESRQASFRLDGTNHTDSYFQQNQPFPFPDALQEFSIQTSNYSAAQGASAGAVVNAVTRSGTNNFHGGAFGYVRDRTFNSKNFFLPERDFLKRKQYGGYAGGPIVSNKLFYFAGWQGTKIQNVGGTLNNTVPTAAMRAGDFSAITTPLRDPNGGFFPNNQIPVGRFDPASVNVMKYLPVGPGNGVGGLVQVPRRIGQDDNQVIAKVDMQLNQNNQVSARYFFDHFTNDPTYTEGNLLSYRGPTLGSRQRIQNVVGQWQRTMTSTLLNEFRVGFNKFASSRYPPSGVPSMQDLGVRLPIYPTDPSISQIEATGFFGIGDNLFATFPRHGVEINDRVNWAKGRHQVQFGGEMAFQDVKIRNEFRRAGHNTFASSTTAGTGHALSDFALGIINTFDQGTGEYKDYKVFYASSFFQDDMKVSDTLTLNMGVRFEHSPPWHEVEGRIMHWSVADYNANVRSTVFPAAPRGETFRGDAGFVGEEGVEASPEHRSARASALRGTSPATATRRLRGGGGTFYDQRRDGESGNGAVNAAPFSLRLAVTRPAWVPFCGSLSRPQRLQPHHRRGRRHGAGAVPDSRADLDLRRRIQGPADLQLQPHVRARAVQRPHGASGLRRFAQPQRTTDHLAELRRQEHRRRDHRQHRRPPALCCGRTGSNRVTGAGSPVELQLDAARVDQAVLEGLHDFDQLHAVESRRGLRRRGHSVQHAAGSGAVVGSAQPGSPSSLHHVVGLGYPGLQRRTRCSACSAAGSGRASCNSRQVVRTRLPAARTTLWTASATTARS